MADEVEPAVEAPQDAAAPDAEQAVDPLQALQARIVALDEQIAAFAKEATDDGAFENADARLAAVEGEISELEGEIDTLDGEVKDSKGPRDDAEKAFSDARAELERLKQVLGECQRKEDEHRARLQILTQTDIPAKEGEKRKAADAVRSAANTLKAVDAVDTDTYEAQSGLVTSAQNALKEIQAALAKLERQQREIQAELSSAESATKEASGAKDAKSVALGPLDKDFQAKDAAYTVKNGELEDLQENLTERRALQTRLGNIKELLRILNPLREAYQTLLETVRSRATYAYRLEAVAAAAETARKRVGELREATFKVINEVMDPLRDVLTDHAARARLTAEALRDPSSSENRIGSVNLQDELPAVDPGAEDFEKTLRALGAVMDDLTRALAKKEVSIGEDAVKEAEELPGSVEREAERTFDRLSPDGMTTQDEALRTAQDDVTRLNGEVERLRVDLQTAERRADDAEAESQRLREQGGIVLEEVAEEPTGPSSARRGGRER